MSSAIGIIQGFHAMIAMQRSEPHWMLNDRDATQYGTALANAMRHFPVQATQKALDFAALAFCVFSFETPRVALSMQMTKRRQQAAQQPAGATSYNVGGNGAAQPPNGAARPAATAMPMAEPPAPEDAGEFMQ